VRIAISEDFEKWRAGRAGGRCSRSSSELSCTGLDPTHGSDPVRSKQSTVIRSTNISTPEEVDLCHCHCCRLGRSLAYALFSCLVLQVFLCSSPSLASHRDGTPSYPSTLGLRLGAFDCCDFLLLVISASTFESDMFLLRSLRPLLLWRPGLSRVIFVCSFLLAPNLGLLRIFLAQKPFQRHS
jgi:hypothetical protein